ncbi:MAG: deoxyguanosinetriphosphate triphosphohydrolase [Pseudorhodoplanes sp.]|uniref:deoxyguanosinetriphosphate triphosphohydrolase n=1 Tax=Pseudorhodoplanes sp. TaxID=1934341 RepID=UPI003D13DDC4
MAIQSAPRAPYASDPALSRGRLVPEPPSPSRNDFRRDCDRIIHSAAFRRLKFKTQVFVFHEGDHYRTRLTHTLEVQQIARSLARVLGLDEDLAEALSLAHDLGHPPFGHIGERALDDELKPYGGFDHNAQALRLVTSLERRYADFDGLNLTWETLEGLVKHNGPLTDRAGNAVGRYRERGVPRAIADFGSACDLQLWSYSSAEAQVAAISDDIAYDAHDIDDGLRAGLFRIEDLEAVPFAGGISREIRRRHPGLEPARFTHEMIRRLITWMIEDVAAESTRRLEAISPLSVEEVRDATSPVIAFSDAMTEAERAIKDFLYPRMYRHDRVMRVMREAEGVLHDLFRHFLHSPGDMPEEWRTGLAGADDAARALRVGDFIAGMTDRFALAEHRRFFDSTPELR